MVYFVGGLLQVGWRLQGQTTAFDFILMVLGGFLLNPLHQGLPSRQQSNLPLQQIHHLSPGGLGL